MEVEEQVAPSSSLDVSEENRPWEKEKDVNVSN